MERSPLPFSAPDGRTEPRIGDALLVSYTIAEDIKPEFTETYDIGTGGLAMLTNAALPAAMPLMIDLELRGDARPKLRLNANVRWSSHDEYLEKYRTGVEFVDLDEHQERELLRYIDTIHHLRDLGVL